MQGVLKIRSLPKNTRMILRIFVLEKIHILEDMKEGHTLQVKLNKAARLKYAKALLNAKGAR